MTWKQAFAPRGPARRVLQGAFTGLFIGALAIAASRLGLLEAYELSTVDKLMRLFADPEDCSSDIAVISIDESTVRDLQNEGYTLPFPREIWTNLVLALLPLQPRAIMFDYTFKDKRESNTRPLDATPPNDARGVPTLSYNAAFGEAEWTSGRVVIGLDTAELGKGLSKEAIDRETGFEPIVSPYFESRIVPTRVNGPVARKLAVEPDKASYPYQPEGFILAGSRAVGYVDTLQIHDIDDNLRRFAPVSDVNGAHFVDLAFAGLAVDGLPGRDLTVDPFLKGDAFVAPAANEGLPTVEILPGKALLRAYEIPLRGDGTAWIRWRGTWLKDPQLRDKVVSGADILTRGALDVLQFMEVGGEVPAEVPDGVTLTPTQLENLRVAVPKLRNKFILVGFTIQGESSDLASTPFQRQPGVFKYAATLDTVLTKSYLRELGRPAASCVLLLVATLTGGIALTTSERLRRRTNRPLVVAVAALLPGLLIGGIYVGATLLAFQRGWILDSVATHLSIVGTTLLCAVTVFAVAQRESLEEAKRKEHFFNLARQGLGPQVVDELLKQGQDAIPKAGGERKTLTLYFSDIAGFTTISEKLEPIELVNILNEYFERVARVLVNKHHGYLDKFIGDAVMASWGGFGADKDGPVRACNAALDARDLIKEFSDDLQKRGLPRLATRIGLNSGVAVAAWVGLPGQRWYYTAFGDTVNLASRLEGANKAYGTTIMIGPITYEEAKHAIVARELDLVRVKGKKIPVHVYELMGRADEPLVREREIKRRYEAALAKYRAKDFTGALVEFEALVSEFDDSAAKSFAEFCKERIATPPEEGWDGSNELHEK